MKIVFFGSDDFAALHLEHLLKAGHQVAACVTGPDRPQGRRMKVTISPIKKMAIQHKIPYLQPITLKTGHIAGELNSYQADIFVVVAYGRLLTKEILEIPKFLCINVHGSILPKYRGAAPVNWAVLNGDKETGVTIQKMALALDSGEVIAQEKMRIEDDENAAQLRQRMALVGAQLLAQVLETHSDGRFPLTPQDESKVSVASKLTKEMGKIDWHKSAQVIANQVRGLQPWPGAYTFFNGKMLKILHASASAEGIGSFKPGQVIKTDKNGFYIACMDKAILIKEVQPEAGRAMPVGSFVAGYKIAQGFLFDR